MWHTPALVAVVGRKPLHWQNCAARLFSGQRLPEPAELDRFTTAATGLPVLNALSRSGVRLAAALTLVSSSSAAAQSIRLSPQPILTIGTEERGEPYMLDRINGALRLPDGSIFVGNSGTGELRLFDSRGTYVRSASRAGAGPGEFEQGAPIRPFRLGEHAVIADAGSLARVNRYDLRGEKRPQFVLKSRPDATLSVVEGTYGNTVLARVTANARLSGAPGERIAPKFRYALYDSTGAQRYPLFELPTAERIVHTYGGRTRYPWLPFSPNPVIAIGDGKVFLIRVGAPTIEMWSLEGKQLGQISWNTTRVRVKDVWSRWREADLATMTRQVDKLFYQDYFSDRLPLPEFVPVAEAMHVDPLGRLWVMRTRMPWERAAQCEVVDQSGKLIARLQLPDRFTLFQVGRDFVLGKGRDADDVEQVQMYRVESVAHPK